MCAREWKEKRIRNANDNAREGALHHQNSEALQRVSSQKEGSTNSLNVVAQLHIHWRRPCSSQSSRYWCKEIIVCSISEWSSYRWSQWETTLWEICWSQENSITELYISESGPVLLINEMEEGFRFGLIIHVMRAIGETTRQMVRAS